MRICHLWHNFFPTGSGGLEKYVLNLSDFLSRHDSSLNFLMLTDRSDISFPLRYKLPKQQRINSIEVHRLGPTFSSYLRNLSYKIPHSEFKRLDDLLIKSLFNEAVRIPGMDKVDVFHLHGFWRPRFPVLAMWLSQHFHVPLVISLHGDSVDSHDPYAMSLEDPIIFQVLRQASVITTFSGEVLDLLGKLGFGKKSILLPNFINVKSFYRPISYPSNLGARAIMVSRLEAGKDPLTPVRAFAAVKEMVPSADLQIVGDGQLFKPINNLIKDLNLGESVTLVGAKKDVRKFLWSSDVFIGTKSGYIATLEAWAAGLAVIVPEYGIFKGLISDGENGLLVQPGNSEQLAASLISLFKNKTLQKTLASNGMQSVKEHDISVIALRVNDIYHSVTGKR
jgi:glycosyltransferase involved in cell wall biosynthesis